MKPFQALTFDAAGTLIHLAEPVGNSYAAVASGFGVQIEPTALDAAFRIVWKKTAPPFSRSTTQQGIADDSTGLSRTDDPEKAWWRDLVRAVFSEAGSGDFPQFDAFFATLYDHFESPGCWTLDEAARDVLNHFSERGFKLGLLSNFDSRLRRILSDLEIFDSFHAVVLSGEIRAAKPDRRMFDRIQQELGIDDAAQILHVGDDAEADIAGAKRAGFQAFRVKNEVSPLRNLLKLEIEA